MTGAFPTAPKSSPVPQHFPALQLQRLNFPAMGNAKEVKSWSETVTIQLCFITANGSIHLVIHAVCYTTNVSGL
jgi:hypothetical protein